MFTTVWLVCMHCGTDLMAQDNETRFYMTIKPASKPVMMMMMMMTGACYTQTRFPLQVSYLIA